jgi:hypothetical protein
VEVDGDGILLLAFPFLLSFNSFFRKPIFVALTGKFSETLRIHQSVATAVNVM